MYKCGWQGCEKAYGTLNHLNAHVTMQSHGAKRTPEGWSKFVFGVRAHALQNSRRSARSGSRRRKRRRRAARQRRREPAVETAGASSSRARVKSTDQSARRLAPGPARSYPRSRMARQLVLLLSHLTALPAQPTWKTCTAGWSHGRRCTWIAKPSQQLPAALAVRRQQQPLPTAL
jgi:hypothetical protein